MLERKMPAFFFPVVWNVMFAPRMSEWNGSAHAWNLIATVPTATTSSSSRNERVISGAKAKTTNAAIAIAIAVVLT